MFGSTGDHKGWQKFCVLSVDLGVVVAAGRDFDSFEFAYTVQGKKKKKLHSYKAVTHLKMFPLECFQRLFPQREDKPRDRNNPLAVQGTECRRLG